MIVETNRLEAALDDVPREIAGTIVALRGAERGCIAEVPRGSIRKVVILNP
jgi:hypothetical protein